MFFCSDFCNDASDQKQLIVYSQSGRSQMDGNSIKDIVVSSKGFMLLQPSKYQQYLSQCRKTNQFFTDTQFPPNNRSLNYQSKGRQIVWMRIRDVYKNCEMVQGKIEPADIQQGNSGDCYFLAAISALAQNPQRIQLIFDKNMKLNGFGLYKLIVNFQGRPKQLIIDDYIPVFAQTKRPVFCKPNGKQIWVMLLEKAWAKICGSYGNISTGYPHQVLNCFSIAPCFYYQVSSYLSYQQEEVIWKSLLQGQKNNFAMCCGSKQKPNNKGIRQNHTYTLLSAYEIQSKDNAVHKILKIRNPWGQMQYDGQKSEKDQAFWSSVSEVAKKFIFQKKNENDGIFTIPYQQFLKNFQSVDISHNHQKWTYIPQPIVMNQNQPAYFALEVKQEGQYYITLEKSFDRNITRQKSYEYGYCRLLIAQFCGENNFEYIDSKLQSNFPDLTLRCKKLKQGVYFILAQSNFPNKYSSYGSTISIYTGGSAIIKKVSKPSPTFLQSVFMSHAIKYNQSKNQIGPYANDWVASKLLIEEGGYGYIAAMLDQKSKRKVQLSYAINSIQKSGYFVEEKYRQDFKRQIGGGQQETIVFSVNMENNKQMQFSFPPQSFTISKVI